MCWWPPPTERLHQDISPGRRRCATVGRCSACWACSADSRWRPTSAPAPRSRSRSSGAWWRPGLPTRSTPTRSTRATSSTPPSSSTSAARRTPTRAPRSGATTSRSYASRSSRTPREPRDVWRTLVGGLADSTGWSRPRVAATMLTTGQEGRDRGTGGDLRGRPRRVPPAGPARVGAGQPVPQPDDVERQGSPRGRRRRDPAGHARHARGVDGCPVRPARRHQRSRRRRYGDAPAATSTPASPRSSPTAPTSWSGTSTSWTPTRSAPRRRTGPGAPRRRRRARGGRAHVREPGRPQEPVAAGTLRAPWPSSRRPPCGTWASATRWRRSASPATCTTSAGSGCRPGSGTSPAR